MTLVTSPGTAQAATGLLPTAPRCPQCSSRDLADLTPPEEDRGWWSRLHCRDCGHHWSIRS